MSLNVDGLGQPLSRRFNLGRRPATDVPAKCAPVHKADPWKGQQRMNGLDWAVLIGYFGVMVAIGLWSHKRVDNVSDFFTAGGKMPWWLSGISHHMLGDSSVLFTGYAGIAYP